MIFLCLLYAFAGSCLWGGKSLDGELRGLNLIEVENK